MEPFEVKLFYTRNEYMRILDFFEGDDGLPDDLCDSLVEGIREQVGQRSNPEPELVGTVATTKDLRLFTKYSQREDTLFRWIDTEGGVYTWDEIADDVLLTREPA